MPAQVIEGHPKLVTKWAKRYIRLYRSEGPDEAKKWALEFLPAPYRQLMVDRVNEILHKNKKGKD